MRQFSIILLSTLCVGLISPAHSQDQKQVADEQANEQPQEILDLFTKNQVRGTVKVGEQNFDDEELQALTSNIVKAITDNKRNQYSKDQDVVSSQGKAEFPGDLFDPQGKTAFPGDLFDSQGKVEFPGDLFSFSQSMKTQTDWLLNYAKKGKRVQAVYDVDSKFREELALLGEKTSHAAQAIRQKDRKTAETYAETARQLKQALMTITEPDDLKAQRRWLNRVSETINTLAVLLEKTAR